MNLLPKHLPCHLGSSRSFSNKDRNLLTLQGGGYLDLRPRAKPERRHSTGRHVLLCQRDVSGSPNGPGRWNSCRDKTSPTPSTITQRKDLPTGILSGLFVPLALLFYAQRVINVCQRGYSRHASAVSISVLVTSPRQTQARVNRLDGRKTSAPSWLLLMLHLQCYSLFFYSVIH